MKCSLLLLTTLSCYSAFYVEKGALQIAKVNNGMPYTKVELSYIPLPPFLRSVEDQARNELFTIIHNSALTKAQVKDNINKWAKRQGNDIEDAYAKFWKQLDDIKSSAKKEIQYQLDTLEKTFLKLEEIMANESITMKEEKKQMDALFGSLDKDVLRTLNLILSSCEKKYIRNRRSQRRNMSVFGDIDTAAVKDGSERGYNSYWEV